MKPGFLSTLLLASLIAGCLGGTHRADFATTKAAVDAAAAPALRLDHDDPAGHFAAHLHTGSANMELVGYSNGVDDSGKPNAIPAKGTYTEIAVTPGYAYLAGNSPDGSFGGFSIISIQDPAKPHVVSRWAGQPLFDVEIDETDALAFVATQRNSADQIAGGLQTTQDPTSNLPRGINVIDISDPKAPRLDSFTPMPYNGPHTLTFVHHPNGNDYLLACTYDLVTDPVTGAIASAVAASQRLVVFAVQHNPATTGSKVSLSPVAQFQIVEPSTTGRLVFPHDSKVEIDAVTGHVFIDLAYWDKGVRILDFTNPPAAPQLPPGLPGATPELGSLTQLREVGSFTDFSPSAYNNIHLARDLPADVAGTHVTVAEPEIISAPDETGYITFLNTTDRSHPQHLSSWTLPAQDPALGVRDLDFSPHNFDFLGGHVVLAHYHAGVWVIDVSDADNLAHPKETGFYMPAIPRTNSPAKQPDVWGVVQQSGLLYVSDEATGLYVLRYTGP